MVAIKDFGMPSCCVNCDMCLPCALNEGLCHITQHTIGNIYDKRPSDCPLVEIGTCKDCKHVYCGHHEETCDIDEYDPDFYCKDFKRRGSENG